MRVESMKGERTRKKGGPGEEEKNFPQLPVISDVLSFSTKKRGLSVYT
jgi:hypothetical protein